MRMQRSLCNVSFINILFEQTEKEILGEIGETGAFGGYVKDLKVFTNKKVVFHT